MIFSVRRRCSRLAQFLVEELVDPIEPLEEWRFGVVAYDVRITVTGDEDHFLCRMRPTCFGQSTGVKSSGTLPKGFTLPQILQ